MVATTKTAKFKSFQKSKELKRLRKQNVEASNLFWEKDVNKAKERREQLEQNKGKKESKRKNSEVIQKVFFV